ncbi:flavin reductase family protein [Mesonia ostreae]|uniref:Flavin reductase n=1 Tax=Mesonia ostreae TaxID=861110 RepID=A0ABU2KEV9_9FLAO|nr:flavin reductase [Mesonia ostreae]MDT0293198.1 flavin reductase [Mesonia ostreae]
MKFLDHKDIDQLESRFRAHFINSLSGIKSANLIATKSENNISNVAIFSSVIHLGSHPPLLGFILKPAAVKRNTYDNIEKTGYFTVNHISENLIKDAHHTSAKYDGETSEFDKTSLTELYQKDFFAPYVKQAQIRIGCSFQNSYFIEENGCYMIIGKIEQVFYPEAIQSKEGWINLAMAKTVGVNGLDAYAKLSILDRFHYAKPNSETTSKQDDEEI